MGYRRRVLYIIYRVERSLLLKLPHWPHLTISQFCGFVTGGGDTPKLPCIMDSGTKWNQSGHKEGNGIKYQQNCQVS